MSDENTDRINLAVKTKCACCAADARGCYIVRYDVDPADDCLDDGRCECGCHSWRQEDELDEE